MLHIVTFIFSYSTLKTKYAKFDTEYEVLKVSCIPSHCVKLLKMVSCLRILGFPQNFPEIFQEFLFI